jgi:DNA-binding response OmpR family regulator
MFIPTAGSARRILLVERDDVIREVLTIVLSDEGYTVSSAPNVQDAVSLLQRTQQQPDLILLDVSPIDQKQREGDNVSRYHPVLDTPAAVIVLSTAPAADTAAWVERIRAQGFVVKPFDLASLLEVVGFWCHSHTRGTHHDELSIGLPGNQLSLVAE